MARCRRRSSLSVLLLALLGVQACVRASSISAPAEDKVELEAGAGVDGRRTYNSDLLLDDHPRAQVSWVSLAGSDVPPASRNCPPSLSPASARVT